ncbi:MAG: hypothetical protein PUJ82_10940 [Spirochaetales bacterium]|nr:hypothetical protein [Spirochaetales bacterium]MDY5916146.1 hypothetical protein [Treponema sp.]
MKKVLLVLFSVFTILFFISCGSKPAPEEVEPEAPVVEENVEPETPVVDETDNIIEPETEQLSEEELAALIAKIDEAREVAILAGAEKNAPDLLNSIDGIYEKAKEENLQDNADSLILKYSILASYAKAKNAKIEIDENDLSGFAQKNYDEGVICLQKVEEALANIEEIEQNAQKDAESAYSNFTNVITIAYKKLAKEQRNLAYEAKVKSDSVRAGVSQKERYKEAADNFKSGDTLYSMQSPKKALEKYELAAQQFTELYEEVSEKRAAAQAAIEAAKRKVQESSQFAEQADEESPITEKLDGIEDADTVLLEEDDYENPEDAEADISEDIDDETLIEESDETDKELIESETETETEAETEESENSEKIEDTLESEESTETNDDSDESDEPIIDEPISEELSEQEKIDDIVIENENTEQDGSDLSTEIIEENVQDEVEVE